MLCLSTTNFVQLKAARSVFEVESLLLDKLLSLPGFSLSEMSKSKVLQNVIKSQFYLTFEQQMAKIPEASLS